MPQLVYIFASISIVFTTAIFGLLINNYINKKLFYEKLRQMNFVNSDRVNKLLGIVLLKKLILKSFWSKLNPTLKLTSTTDSTRLIALYNEMVNAEISHLIGFVITLFIIVGSYLTGFHNGIIVPLFVANIIFHLYPALLQQYNKRRLRRLINMYAKK